MNNTIITLIICLILLVIPSYALFRLIQGLFYYIKGTAKAAKTMLTQPGAMQAYSILTDSADHGYIPDAAIEKAINVMLENGASENDIVQFINYTYREIGFEADIALRKLRSSNFRRELSKDIDRLSNM